MAGTDVTSGIERLQAAIALGIGLKVGELVEIQRAHVDSEVVDLLRSDIAKAASHPDLSPAIHTCLADHSSVEVRFGAVFHPSVSIAYREEVLSKCRESQLRPNVLDSDGHRWICLLYTSPSPRDRTRYRMPSSA